MSCHHWALAALACISCSRPLLVDHSRHSHPAQPAMSAPAPLQDRPFRLLVPPGLEPSRPAPLLIALHGFGARGSSIDKYFAFGSVAARQGVLYAVPEGRQDRAGRRFWNATDACCVTEGREVDDVAYLKAIIRDVAAHHPVDPKRVFLVGHSNGGFMAYRMACEASELIAGVVSLAGATFKDPARCRPASPVAVLQVHGTHDDVIRYRGGRFRSEMAAYPGAAESVVQWAALNGCTGPLAAAGERLDLDKSVPGAETRVARHAGCPAGAAELWTITGGGHSPRLRSPAWAAGVLAFLLRHPKP